MWQQLPQPGLSPQNNTLVSLRLRLLLFRHHPDSLFAFSLISLLQQLSQHHLLRHHHCSYSSEWQK
jgi:hypothetical protein